MAYVQGPVSRLGAVNAAGGDQNALFLKQFAGEILTVFEEANVMMPTHTVRTISQGKSAQFPATATATAKYHTPGESLIETDSGDSSTSKYLSNVKHNEIVITINDLLVSSAFIADIDEAKNHWDVRSEYSRQMGFALSNEADKNLIRLGLAGARAQGSTDDRFGGNDYLGSSIDISAETSTAAVTGAEVLAGIVDAAQKLDEKDVPGNDRFCVLSPEMYYKLVEENKDAINRDYGNDGNGSLASGVVMSVAGVRLLKSNHIPTADFTPDAGDLSSLSGTYDFTTQGSIPLGLVFQRGALGTVKLMDLSVQSEYQVERMGTLMAASYAMGHDILRNECLVELKF